MKIKQTLLKIVIGIICVLKKKHIYLTFDDGPLNGTNECYEICKMKRIKATFFFIASHINTIKKKALFNNLHNNSSNFLVANHSYSHSYENYYEFYKNPTLVLEDFKKADESMNLTNKLIRLPGYNVRYENGRLVTSPVVKLSCDLLIVNKYKIVGWDIELKSNFIVFNDIFKVILAILRSSKKNNHIIILSHDRDFQSALKQKLLSKFIQILLLLRCDFRTIEEHPIFKC